MSDSEVITLAHGSGGAAMNELIERLYKPVFRNYWLDEGEDQARLDLSDLAQSGNRLAFTTDSYVISPIQFPGGDIGKLSVCGTLNDLAVGGAIPKYLSLSFIIEEGLSLSLFRQIVESIQKTALENEVVIVTGDTKVVPKGSADQLFINTSGVGVIPKQRQLSIRNIKVGDALIVNGFVGNHGAAIADVRESLGFVSDLQSDCASLSPLIEQVLNEAPGAIRCIRDATRGGIAAVANEFAVASQKKIEIFESRVPVHPSAAAICELLGFDPLYLANEGNALWVVEHSIKDTVLEIMRSHALGERATWVGEVTAEHDEGWVTAKSSLGTSRMLDMPVGELLPRIC